MAWGAPGGALAARRRCSQSRGGTPGKGWPAQSGCPSRPAVTHQGLTVIENGFCCAGLLQGMSVGFWGSGWTWSAALACFLIVLPGPQVGGNFQNGGNSLRDNPRSQERKGAGRRQALCPRAVEASGRARGGRLPRMKPRVTDLSRSCCFLVWVLLWVAQGQLWPAGGARGALPKGSVHGSFAPTQARVPTQEGPGPWKGPAQKSPVSCPGES